MPAFLIIDDSTTLRKMVRASLKPLNATFVEASSGLEGLEQLALQPYDAVMLDLNMPDMHGLEFLQFVRGHKLLKNIPILVITTYTDKEMREQVLSAGAERFITKPFEPAELLKAVNEVLNP
jgi:two-component system chemotaxis response regulator CheY